MGYTTDFEGEFVLDRPLTEEHRAYLEKFAGTRRVQRDPKVTEQRADPVREAVGLPVGREGGYFVGAEGFAGQEWNAPGLLSSNTPPAGQPGLWCQWTPNEDGTAIVWDQGEKFYNYVEWLQYIIQHFLTPWGYALKGEVTWQGEEPGDVGYIKVLNNQVFVNEEPSIIEKIADAL